MIVNLARNLLLNVSKENASIFFLGICFLGFVTDHGILSIGMIAMITYLILRSSWPASFKDFYRRKDLMAICGIFFIYALTGFYSNDIPHLAERIRIKIPFLLLPVSFSLLKPYSKKQFHIILTIYLGVMFLAASGVLLNYLLSYQSITESFKYGKSIPTPYSHIRFSLFVVTAVFAGLELLRSNGKVKYDWEKTLHWIVVIFLFITVHILAVRSGLLALYIGLFAWVGFYLIRSKKFIVGSALIGSLILLPLLAYQLIPSLNSRINYMIYDLKMASKETGQEYSDAGRLLSIRVGWELIKDNVWFGVGSGDVRMKVIEYYKEHYPEILTDHNRKSPHNQFITTWLANGFFGLVIFIGCLFYPLVYNKNYKFALLTCFYLVFTSSLFTENTLEIQLGVGLYLLILLPVLNFLYKS